LLDCGLFQGRRKESSEKNRSFPFDGGSVDNVVLSHAHIDHSGRIPLLMRSNFTGCVICTRPTADACKYLLLDSAKIQESDANYLNYKILRSFLHGQVGASDPSVSQREKKKIRALLKKSSHELNIDYILELQDRHQLERVSPLYTIADAEKALGCFEGYPYNYTVPVGENVYCSFYEAGHILGSAFVFLQIRENGRRYTIGYTGDMGRFYKPILKDPTLEFREEDRDVDLLIMETTYGDRVHEAGGDLMGKLRQVLIETFKRGGTVVIPAFAFGRTQEILYYIRELYDRDEVPKKPVYVDSPLAIHLTEVTRAHPEVFDAATHAKFLEKGENPFFFDQLHFTAGVEESMALMKNESPHIVISASGMCEMGRILHHLRYKVHDPRNTILIVGFMAENTLGRRILEQGLEYESSGRTGPPPVVKILNKIYPLKARVVRLEGFSAHADKHELVKLLKDSNLRAKKIALVHGEESQTLSFSKYLSGEGYSVFVPQKGERIEIV
jgi:metallo-beta-lactamase family protein